MINPVWVIQKKRDGKELSDEEVSQFIKAIISGEVTDYQATAFLMAVYFRDMTIDETVALTRAMLESGERYDLAKIPGSKVDKHSTGGVGDKVSLILAPLAASCGLKVPMMSGRGLGHSGGTLDKLEAISGFNVNLCREQFENVLSQVGCVMVGQTETIVPADRKLYALRDVTATVECIPLIVASILSKKIAEGTESLILDVKMGSGAFMKTREQARKLAKALIQVGKKLGLPCRAVITDMSQPLGYAVGNALEVRESIEVLRNEKTGEFSSCDLKELTVQLCAHMLELGGLAKNLVEGRKLARAKLADGSAWRTFQKLVAAQGGSVEQVQEPAKRLPIAPNSVVLKAKKRGYITKMDTEALGKLVVQLGGGRIKASDRIDPGVGIVFHKKLGAKVQPGEPIATLYASDRIQSLNAESDFQSAIEITGVRKSVPKLVFEQIERP